MSELQKIIKYCAMAFAAFLAFTIITGILSAVGAFTGIVSSVGSGKTISESKSFEDVKSISADPGVGSLFIKVGENDKVEVVAENVSDNFTAEKSSNGTLKIKCKYSVDIFNEDTLNGKSKVTIYLPEGFVADKAEINAGAGNINIEALAAKELIVNAGAGNIEGENVSADEADLNGGVGNITLEDVNLTNVKMECGVGNIDLQGSIHGDSSFDCGVGDMDIELTDSSDAYNIEADKGLGSIYIDGEKYSDLNWHNTTAENTLKINGGVGNVEIDFE